MALQRLHSADGLHEDGMTVRLCRLTLDQNFTVDEKHDGVGWPWPEFRQ